MILLGVILVFSISFFFLFLKNEAIKKAHYEKARKMEDTILRLHERQNTLQEKVIITQNFSADYNIHLKSIYNEIFELQKTLLKTILNQKNT